MKFKCILLQLQWNPFTLPLGMEEIKTDFIKFFLCLKDFTQMYQIRVQQKEDMMQIKMKWNIFGV